MTAGSVLMAAATSASWSGAPTVLYPTVDGLSVSRGERMFTSRLSTVWWTSMWTDTGFANLGAGG